jgi:hypothetical protein
MNIVANNSCIFFSATSGLTIASEVETALSTALVVFIVLGCVVGLYMAVNKPEIPPHEQL